MVKAILIFFVLCFLLVLLEIAVSPILEWHYRVINDHDADQDDLRGKTPTDYGQDAGTEAIFREECE